MTTTHGLPPAAGTIYRFGDFELDTRSHELRVEGKRRHVEPQVFDVLAYLFASRDRLVTRDELLDQIWGHRYVSPTTLSSRIKHARQAVDDDGDAQRVIRTVHGLGFRIVTEVEERAATAYSEPAARVRKRQSDAGTGAAGHRATTTGAGASWITGADAQLLERESILSELKTLLIDAAAGNGRIAAIAGEAGAGKTSVVEHFVATHAPDCRVLHGLCDPLSVPRPFGPVYDMATQVDGPLAAALRDNDRESLFSAILAELSAPIAPHVVVIEDVHWADDATLDLLKFVGRRLRRLPVLLILTYRDDEVGPTHQLHRLLGQVPREAMRWFTLPLLSRAAVEEMALGKERDADGIYELTGGNPFFVTEVFASTDAVVPTSITAALRARAARLSPGARELVDLVAIVPRRVNRELLWALFGDASGRLRECTASGILTASADGAGFRHELARMAWRGTLGADETACLHARVLRALVDGGDEHRELSRIVHHADGAGDVECVIRLAPAAAREAAMVGAHRQAAAHYETALRYANTLSAADRATLLEGFSYEQHLVGRSADALRAREDALVLRRSVHDRRGAGDDLRWLSRLVWMDGRRADAMTFAHEAIGVLEPLGSTPELAMAFSNLAFLSVLTDDDGGATTHGARAIALAERFGHNESLVHTLNALGMVELLTARRDAGLRRLQRSIDLAVEYGFHEHGAHAHTMIACTALWHRDYRQAAAGFDQALRFAIEYELEAWERYILGWRARLQLERGDWEAAERDALSVLEWRDSFSLARCQPLIVLALLRARRGVGDAAALLDQELPLALASAEPHRVGPAVTARAELAWLRDDLASVRPALQSAWETAGRDDRWGVRTGIAWWLWRAGEPVAALTGLPEPMRLQIEDDWQRAAEAWERIGAPYERALALAQGDSPQAWTASLSALDALGAEATAAAVRRDLRRRGVRKIPRPARS